ncbi:MAG: DUF167 domain-containing protein [Actinomycetia bacterium]|nr:DUF167 domain-containing protein [Actinomycetes bacterium]MCP4958867.1 DUF167 domain-containing protein [Actinomycetes bacterium]
MGQDAEVKFWIRVTPNSKRPRIGGTWEGPSGPVLQVAVSARAVDGKANAAVVNDLAKALGLRKSQVEIVAGRTAKLKLIEVPDDTPLPG